MALYKSIIAYDGTDFHGFQRLGSSLRTVQAVVEQALRPLNWRERSLKAAGRTDSGTHARGQVVAYELDWDHGAEVLTRALNAHLPVDVSAWHTEEVAQEFHPRFSARSRRYSYRLIVSSTRDPLRERYAWRAWPAPDLTRMEETAAGILGRHDFGAFGRAPIPEGHTQRTVLRANWGRSGDEYRFQVEADAFLYRMVRRLVAAMLEIGMGRKGPEDVLGLLDDPSRRWEGRVAPAKGLCLEAVIYA